MPDYDSMSMSEIFKLDSDERIKTLNKEILQLEKEGQESPSLFDEAMREAHSLKAAARIVNCRDVQDLAHKMEEIIQTVKGSGKNFGHDFVDLCLEVLDAMTEIVDAFVTGGTHQVDVSGLLKRLGRAKEGEFQPKDKDEAPEKKEEPLRPSPVIAEQRKPEGDSTKKRASVEKAMVEKEKGATAVRVGIDKLEKLLNLSGEIYTNTLNLEKQRLNSRRLVEQLAGVVMNFESISAILDEEKNVPSKFYQWISKSRADMGHFRESFLTFIESIDTLGVSFGYLGAQLQDEVMRSRMLPLATVFDMCPRLVRDLARQYEKKIVLNVLGAQTQIDKVILEIIKDPLMHLIRNACDHGIEGTQERQATGKPQEGTITLSAYTQADRVVIIVEDDGRGVDVESVKAKILEKNIIEEEKIKNLSREEVLNFIFLPGFSTAKEVTAISGRGVGLDVVKSNISRIGGRIQLETESGRFNRIILSIPLTLVVTRSLLVYVGGEIFCFPMTAVEEVVKVAQKEIRIVETRDAIDIRGEIISLVRLGSLWNLSSAETISDERELVVIGRGREKVALWVDKLVEEKDVVIKPLDRRLKNIQDVSGGTVLDNGLVAFIVDIDSLIRSSADYMGKSLVSRAEEAKQIQRKRILIAEDSLTVRELERKVLENNGYDVVAAFDGMDAWVKVKETKIDLLVTDIEMPRIDGFELISLMKKDKDLCNIPTVIVSFKEREEDKRRGMQVGADKYITKSQYEDKTLLEAIARLINRD